MATSLSYQSDDVNEMNEAINNNLIDAFEWLKGNKLPLIVAKTKAMVMFWKQKEKQLAENSEALSLNIQEERISSVPGYDQY